MFLQWPNDHDNQYLTQISLINGGTDRPIEHTPTALVFEGLMRLWRDVQGLTLVQCISTLYNLVEIVTFHTLLVSCF